VKIYVSFSFKDDVELCLLFWSECMGGLFFDLIDFEDPDWIEGWEI